MNNINCDNCNYYQTEVCPIYHHDLPFDACPNHISKRKLSLFAYITASPEVLAPNLVFWEGGWTSRFIKFTTTNREEAIAATVAKLKEVYNETTSN